MIDTAHSRPAQPCCPAWHDVAAGQEHGAAGSLVQQPVLAVVAHSCKRQNVQAEAIAAGVRGVLFPMSVKQTQASLSLTQMIGQVTSSGMA